MLEEVPSLADMQMIAARAPPESVLPWRTDRVGPSSVSGVEI